MILSALRKKLQRTSPWLLTVCGVVLLFLGDMLIFHTGLYRHYLDPESTAGQLYLMTSLSLKHAKDMENAVAVCGDSRVAEGFSAKLANESAGRVQFANFAIFGTTPRVWYYQLRELDPHADRFPVIAIMLPNYDECILENFNERTLDLNYLAPILRFEDIVSFPESYSNRDMQMHSAICILLRGTAFKQDIVDFLGNPGKRLRSVAVYRKHWQRGWNYEYTGRTESLDGLAPDPAAKGGLRFPENISPELKPRLQAYFAEMDHREPRDYQALYRKVWLGKIAERYRNSRTKLVIFQIPRGPLNYLKPSAPVGGALADLQQKYGITILPPQTFEGLERPEFFFDQLHMNARGRQRFSKQLAAILGPMAGESAPVSH